jgi:hypothetical protein
MLDGAASTLNAGLDRLACAACGAHVLLQARLAMAAGRCGCCGGYDLEPVPQRFRWTRINPFG